MKLICSRCKKEIDKKKDNWVKIEIYNKEEMSNQEHYHFICWREQYKDKVRQILKEGVTPMVNQMFGGLFNR